MDDVTVIGIPFGMQDGDLVDIEITVWLFLNLE